MWMADRCPWALFSFPVSLGTSNYSLLCWRGCSNWWHVLTPATVYLLSLLPSLWGCHLQPFHPWPTVCWQQSVKGLNVFWGHDSDNI